MKAALAYAVGAGVVAACAPWAGLALAVTLLAVLAMGVLLASPVAIRDRMQPLAVLLLVLSVLAWAPAAARWLE